MRRQATIDRLKKLDKMHFLHPTSSIKEHQENGPIAIFVEGDGIYLTDVNGDVYIDGMSSLWNVNVGHGREEIGEVAKAQMGKLQYTSSFNNFSNESVIELSAKVASMTPGNLNVCFYTSGGSEANDTAFKLVRHYWKLKGQPERRKIISRERGFHGITVGATSATAIGEFQDMATAKAPDFLHSSAKFSTNCELGDKSDPDYEKSMRGIIESEGPETIAAVILEPVQGAGGVRIPPEGYMQAVRKLCDEYGVLMIADEVICGFGRTGKPFGVDNWNVVPDLMTIAKGFTSGYAQLGAVVLKESLRDELAELSTGTFFHGFTYSGHSTACAVAMKNIEIVEEEDLTGNAKRMETELRKGLEYLETNLPGVTNSRALGLLGGIDLKVERDKEDSLKPGMLAQRVVEECFKRKLILRPINYGGKDTIVMAPPLIISKEQIGKMINILYDSISSVIKQ